MKDTRKTFKTFKIFVLSFILVLSLLAMYYTVRQQRLFAPLTTGSKVNIVVCGQNSSNHTCVFNLLAGTDYQQEEEFQIVDSDSAVRYILIPAFHIEYGKRPAELFQQTFRRAKGPFKLIYVVSTLEGRIRAGKYMKIDSVLKSLHNPDIPWGMVITAPPEIMKNGYSCMEGVKQTDVNGVALPPEEQLTFIQQVQDSVKEGKLRAHACLSGCIDSKKQDSAITNADKSTLQQLVSRLPEFKVTRVSFAEGV